MCGDLVLLAVGRVHGFDGEVGEPLRFGKGVGVEGSLRPSPGPQDHVPSRPTIPPLSRTRTYGPACTGRSRSAATLVGCG